MKKEITNLFKIYGPFDVPREHGISDRTIDREDQEAFWSSVEARVPDLPKAGGCYVFGLRSEKKDKETPWYIGMAEKQTFKEECFEHHEFRKYTEAMSISGNRSSIPIMYFVARCRPKQEPFATISKNGNKAIQVVEKYLIALGVRSNPNLLNVRDASILRGLSVEGLHQGRKPGPQSGQIKSFRDMFMVPGTEDVF